MKAEACGATKEMIFAQFGIGNTRIQGCPQGPYQSMLQQLFSLPRGVERLPRLPLDFSEQPCERFIPCVTPNWDNTPRTDRRGYVYFGSTPDLYKKHLQFSLQSLNGPSL